MEINLFCFPFAGGSKYSYNNYSKLAHKNINVIAIDYPGRGLRFRESLLTDLDPIIEDCFAQIKDKLYHPYALYGHSMGTIVSYLLSKKIIEAGLNPPLHLFLSGRGGAVITYDDKGRYLLPKDKFRQQLREMGGSPDEVLNDEDLMGFFEPILRADFEALENYEYQPTEPLEIPITVMIGKEERVTREQANSWQKETVFKLDVLEFPGKHFFIFEHAETIMRLIAQKLLPGVFQHT